MPPKLKTHPLNVLIDPTDRKRLDELSEHLKRSRGQIVRELINVAWLDFLNGIPMCATGTACSMPQLASRRHVPSDQISP